MLTGISLFMFAWLPLIVPSCQRYDMTCRHLFAFARSFTYTQTVTNHRHHTHFCKAYFPHPCLLVFLWYLCPVSCAVSLVEECMFCSWSVTCTSTVGPNWMWALSEEIRALCAGESLAKLTGGETPVQMGASDVMSVTTEPPPVLLVQHQENLCCCCPN